MYEQAKNTILAYNDNSQDYLENTLYAKAYSILRYIPTYTLQGDHRTVISSTLGMLLLVWGDRYIHSFFQGLPVHIGIWSPTEVQEQYEGTTLCIGMI